MFTNKVNIGQIRYWHPWRGCKKISPACQNCFIKNFKTVEQGYPHPPACNFGDVVIVCLHSDFFIEDADAFRINAWKEIKNHPEQIFLIITKRVERIMQYLPEDWGEGYDNVVFSLTVETQELVDYRIPLFLEIPCKHKWLSCCPLIEPLNIEKYLITGQIECIETCGETGDINIVRPTYYKWVEDLSSQCKATNTKFLFMKSGIKFIKDNQILGEHCACYHSPLADSCNLDNDIKIQFLLNNIEYEI